MPNYDDINSIGEMVGKYTPIQNTSNPQSVQAYALKYIMGEIELNRSQILLNKGEFMIDSFMAIFGFKRVATQDGNVLAPEVFKDKSLREKIAQLEKNEETPCK